MRSMTHPCAFGALAAILACGAGCMSPIPVKEPEERGSKSEVGCADQVVSDTWHSLAMDRATPLSQTRLPERAPLQLFPRLTAPVFVENSELGACQGQGFFIPVLFEAHEGSPRGAEPKDDLAFWLESAKPGENKVLIRLGDPRAPLVYVKPLDDGKVQALVFRLAPTEIPQGFYWLRILPRFKGLAAAQNPECGELCRAFADGDLAAIQRSDKTLAPGFSKTETDLLLQEFACKFWLLPAKYSCAHPYIHFWPELHRARKALSKIGKARAKNSEPSPETSELFWAAVKELYYEDHSPAAVKLGSPASDAPLRFIAAADFQERDEMRRVKQFLSLVDPEYPDKVESVVRRLHGEPGDSDELKKEIAQAEFVIFSGDLADAQASSNLFVLAANVFGLMPPRSPYRKEFSKLRKVLRNFGKPFVAVPGNHDGYVGYPGIINWLFSQNRLTDRLNDFIPVFLKPPLPRVLMGKLARPRYDGLQEWRYELGPTSYAFTYAGHLFAGMNTYNLEPYERTAVGAVVFNWGGGVRPHDIAALKSSLEHLRASGETTREFFFMHHDPRSSFPEKKSREIDQYGIYDEIDTLTSFLTLGHFGLGHSPQWDLYIPVFTPISYQGARLFERMISGMSRAQEEWMRRSFWIKFLQEDVNEHYGAEALTQYLDERRPRALGEPGIAGLFLGHDNNPLTQEWASPDQQGAVFPRVRGEKEWKDKEFHHAFNAVPMPGAKVVARRLFKLRNDEPPAWARAMQGNPAQNFKAYRLDDVADGSSRGFALVEIPTDSNKSIKVTHFKISDP